MFVYIFCKVLTCLAFFLLLFSSLLEDGWIYFIYFFLSIWYPAGASTFTENYTKQWAVSNFLSLFALKTRIRKRTGGGGFPLHLSCTLVNFVHGNHTGGFLIF